MYYGIWNLTLGVWLQDDVGVVLYFPAQAIAVAQLQILEKLEVHGSIAGGRRNLLEIREFV